MLNLPIPPLARDSEYRLLFEHVVCPVAEIFRPELVIVAAGFDAHWRDPQGGMLLSTCGLVAIMGALCDLARAHCGGRIAYVLEGGYDLDALGECVAGTLGVLAGAAWAWPDGDAPRPEIWGLVRRAQNELAFDR